MDEMKVPSAGDGDPTEGVVTQTGEELSDQPQQRVAAISQSIKLMASLGLPVFPCHSIVNGNCSCGKAKCDKPGKHPRTPNGSKDASLDPKQISSWLLTFPECNWAVRPDKCVVIDPDLRHDGDSSLWLWEQASGRLPATLVAKTGGGGRHLYFRLPPGAELGNRIAWLPGVDVKVGDRNGYVLLPGSNHASGGLYTWENIQTPAECPSALLQALQTAGPIATTGADLRDAQSILQGVPEGKRDDTLFRYACRARRQHSGDADGGRAAVTTLVLTAARNCAPPFPEDQALAKVEQAFRQDHSDDGQLPLRQRLSDDGNAILFVQQHGDSLRYASDARAWFAWDGTRWQPNGDMIALDLARQTARSLVEVAQNEPDDNVRSVLLKWASASLSAGRIKAMPDLGKSDPSLAIMAGSFDADPWVLNTPSGTVDLRSGELRDHRRDDYLSKITGVSYDQHADAPRWLEWLKWAMAGRMELVEFLQRAVGHAITGTVEDQHLHVLFGTGANGKSTFLGVMRTLLGDYAWHAEPELLMGRPGANTTGLADLQGRRFVTAIETEEGQKLSERTVKHLTGGDDITARRLYQNFVSFKPTHKIFFAVNHRPTIKDDSHGMWRRVLLIPWEARVTDAEKDGDLQNRLIRDEGPGILRWAVEGALKWQRDGLQVPDVVRAETQRYRDEQDTLGDFVEQNLIADATARTPTSEVTLRYELWCAQNLIVRGEKLGRTTFLARLEEKYGLKKERARLGGSNVNCIIGARLRSEGELWA